MSLESIAKTAKRTALIIGTGLLLYGCAAESFSCIKPPTHTYGIKYTNKILSNGPKPPKYHNKPPRSTSGMYNNKDR